MMRQSIMPSVQRFVVVGALTFVSACGNLVASERFVAEAFPVPDLNGQLAPVATTLVDSIGIVVQDAAGRRMSGVRVSWQVAPGGGSVAPRETFTNNEGIARAEWTLGEKTGLYGALAVVEGLQTPVRVDARALPGAVATMTLSLPDGATVAVGRTALVLAARVDGYGNVVTDGHPAWVSLDPSIASVNGTGVITGVGVGTARIRASQDGTVAETTIQITASAAGGWVDIDAGGNGTHSQHTCGVTDGGRVYCWGYNDGGQLGNGTIVPRDAPFAVDHPDGVHFIKVRAGNGASRLTCALAQDGDIYCWGSSATGSGGGASTRPVRVSATVDFVELDVGLDHVCGLTNNGAVYCWGTNQFGQLGIGTTTTAPTPALVTLPASATHIALTAESSCAVVTTGAVYCWGRNNFRQLGSTNAASALSPRLMTTPLPDAVIALGAGVDHTCAVIVDGAIYCWGRNNTAQLGSGEAGSDSPTPVRVALPVGMAARFVSGGAGHGCATSSAGNLYCWGANADGQQGAGDGLDHPTPRAAVTPANVTFTAVSLGGTFSCAITAAGEAYCWGSDTQGQLGNGALPPGNIPSRITHP